MSISREEFASFGLDFTDDEIAGIRAGGEQISAALVEAESYDFAEHFPVFKRLPDVRKMITVVMALHRRAMASRGPRENSPYPHDLSPMVDVVEVGESRGGHWLSDLGDGSPYDKIDKLLDPDRSARLLGVFAGAPHEVHPLTDKDSVDRWLAGRCSKHGKVKCDWGRYAYKWPTRAGNEIQRNCFDGLTIYKSSPRDAPISYLVFANGPVLIAVATCDSCRDWLMSGGSV